MDITKLVFLDESGINTGMTRLYGRGFKGERVIEYVPDVRFKRTSILSSIRLDGSCVPTVFSGSLNGELFKKYLKDFLVPTLAKDDIVVMDNLSSHKVVEVKEIIESSGATLLYLPPYSPDLNPIEPMWSKIKAYLRKIKARTVDILFESIAEALRLITKTDIKGWFKHSGYSERKIKPL